SQPRSSSIFYISILAIAWLCLGILGLIPATTARAEPALPVDLTLVLAADSSGSLTRATHKLQRQGHIDALRHPAFIRAVTTGRHGRVAVAYLEWATSGKETVVVPMTLISSAEDAQKFADRLASADHNRRGYTAIGSALNRAAELMDDPRFAPDRRVIDLSANGQSNHGAGPALIRAGLVDQGITINGLPIIADQSLSEGMRLESYFADCIIGGPGAFYLPVTAQEDYVRILLAKMVYEIAGRRPPPQARILPAAMRNPC
ncbi:MAG: DUF1194 domain-containing protein, partial [Mangrovicoccus sp.]